MESIYRNMENGNSLSREKEEYTKPQVEVLEIKLEKGFAASPVNSGGFGNTDWGTGTW